MHVLNPYKTGSGFAPIPTGNITSYFKLNSDANDSVGTKNGTATDISYVTGLIGNAASFNGTTSKISLPNEVIPTFVGDKISLCVLVKSSDTTTETRFVSLNDNSPNSYISIRLNVGGVANRIGAFAYDSNADATLKTVDGYTTTDWTLVTMTLNYNDNYKIYVNNSLEYTDSTFGSPTQVGTLGNHLGSSRAGTSFYFTGLINAFAVFDKELSLDEIISISNKLLVDNTHLI